MKTFLKHCIIFIITLEARLLIARKKPTIIAVTGNIGKTSVKDAIYEVLKQKMHARKSEKSFNSEIGVPLSVLGLESGWSNPFLWFKNIVDGALLVIHPGDYPKVLVLEMGVDRPGDMEKLTKWVRPHVVVLTRLPDIPVHVEFFGSPEAVAREKIKLVEALRPEGTFVYNQDDEKVVHVAEGILQQSIGYSRYSESDFTATGDATYYEGGFAMGTEFTISHGKESRAMRVAGSLGVQHAYTYAAAAAVGSIFGISLEEASTALQDHVPPPGRMRLVKGIKDTLIIDDTYNASPAALERSLQTLKELKGAKRKIAILGDMMELGNYSIDAHEHAGALVHTSASLLMTVGVRARGYAKGALTHGMSEKKILQYDDALQAGRELQALIKPGDVILVKASQSIRAERIVEEVMAEPERANDLLARQGDMWKFEKTF
jgi:UDP-N-acetylmuramoyl-tripeptide--D-alanyl-D-alanine ligase